MKNKLKNWRSRAWLLTIVAAVAMAPMASQGIAVKVCGAYVTGCKDTGSSCSLISPKHGWSWVSAWACNGSSYVPGSFSCDDFDNGGCCNIEDQKVCPPWSCPC